MPTSTEPKEPEQDAVDRAARIFEEKSLRFTELRRRVLEEIVAAGTSVGAYEILDRLAKKGTRLAPISIYRALEALQEAGVVHRLESKNAYFAARQLLGDAVAKKAGRPIFLSCEVCGQVIEANAEGIFAAIGDAARALKFTPRVKFVEVSGTCAACAARQKAHEND